MSIHEKDFIMRQVRLLARAVARIVLKARSDGDFVTGLQALRTVAAEMLDCDDEFLGRLDPTSVSMMTRDAMEMQALAWLASQEGALHGGAGDAVEARRLQMRAAAL